MSLFKRPKSYGHIPGPRPRLPDEENGFWRTLLWVLAIGAAITVVLLFRKQHGA